MKSCTKDSKRQSLSFACLLLHTPVNKNYSLACWSKRQAHDRLCLLPSFTVFCASFHDVSLSFGDFSCLFQSLVSRAHFTEIFRLKLCKEVSISASHRNLPPIFDQNITIVLKVIETRFRSFLSPLNGKLRVKYSANLLET